MREGGGACVRGVRCLCEGERCLCVCGERCLCEGVEVPV